MSIEQYVLGNVIGKGSYGEVTLARHKKDKKQYVIKKIDLHNASPKERLFAQQEVEILSKLRHPNIVSYKESFQTSDGGLSIVMGYCESGDMYTKLKKQAKIGEYLEETQIVEWFVQIAMALQYMHDRHILHRDLKTQNIFLTKSKIIKLGDLGIARVLDSNLDMATTMIGTPYYMSPELFSNKPYNHKSDVWALGCCVYEMATLKHAFNAKDMNSLVYKILKGKTPAMPKHYTSELQEIIKSMLNYSPNLRPSASRILRHPFIKKHIAIFLEGTKNRRKSRDEKPRKTAPKVSKDSRYSESSVGSKNNAEVIATASKVELDILDVNDNPDECVQNKKVPDILPDRKEREVQKDNSLEHKKTDELKVKHGNNNAGPDLVSCSDPSDSDKHKDLPGNEKSSHVRKVLSEKVQAKARLKKDEILSKKNEKNHRELQIRKKLEEKLPQTPPEERVSRKISDGKWPRRRRQELSKRPLPVCPVPNENNTPKLPPPRFKSDIEEKPSNQEVVRDQCKTPKVSSGVPNLAARRKRRQRQQELESQMSQPALQKRGSESSLSGLSYPSYTPRSHEEIIKEHLQRRSTVDEPDSVDGPQRSNSLQSIDVESGSENDDAETSQEKSNNDVSNLIVTLQATLKMDSKSKHRGSPEDSVDADDTGNDFSPSASGRLKDRIKRLRSECISGLGEAILHEAYRIIDTQTEESVESALVELMGKQKFEDYGGQIWQLKFCEEFKL